MKTYPKQKAQLEHVDYQCGGEVRPDPLVGLRCKKCKMGTGAGPMTVVGLAVPARRARKR